MLAIVRLLAKWEHTKDITACIEEALNKGKEAINKAQYKKEYHINIYWHIPDFDIKVQCKGCALVATYHKKRWLTER